MKWSMICWLEACRTFDDDRLSGLSSGGVGGGAEMLVATDTMPVAAAAAVDADMTVAVADLADA